jgi:hypothetical protein
MEDSCGLFIVMSCTAYIKAVTFCILFMYCSLNTTINLKIWPQLLISVYNHRSNLLIYTQNSWWRNILDPYSEISKNRITLKKLTHPVFLGLYLCYPFLVLYLCYTYACQSYVCLSIRLSVCQSVHPLSSRLPVYPSIYLSVCVFIRPFFFPSVCLAVCLSILLSVYPPFYISVHLSICLLVYPSVCSPVSLSIRLSPPPREIYAVLTVPESVRPPLPPIHYCPPSNMSHIYWDMAATFSLATQRAREYHSSLICFYKNKMLKLYNRGDFGSAIIK